MADGSEHAIDRLISSPPVDGAEYPSTFPDAFVAYCKSNGIPAHVFYDIPWDHIRSIRYMRIRPSLTDSTQRAAILAALSAEAVPWLPCDVFCVPRSIPMATLSKALQEYVCPMDAASMAAVVALQVETGDRVLDLCCCPGMKSLLIADAIAAAASAISASSETRKRRVGSVVGVDVSMDRLMVARSLLSQRYKVQHAVSLVCCDGRHYDPVAMATAAAAAPSMDPKAVEQRVRNARKFVERDRKRQREAQSQCPQPTAPSVTPIWLLYSDAEAALAKDAMEGGTECAESRFLFDKVLVDVECTHDGSLAHLALPSGRDDVQPSSSPKGDITSGGITNVRRMEKMNFHLGEIQPPTADHPALSCNDLQTLQLDLLTRGFQCLKPGGRLVYSTCSFSEGQNEAVVELFLKNVHKGQASLVCHPITPFEETTTQVSPLLSLTRTAGVAAALKDVVTLSTRTVAIELESVVPKQELLQFTSARFWPKKSLTSFQFVAVLHKC